MKVMAQFQDWKRWNTNELGVPGQQQVVAKDLTLLNLIPNSWLSEIKTNENFISIINSQP